MKKRNRLGLLLAGIIAVTTMVNVGFVNESEAFVMKEKWTVTCEFGDGGDIKSATCKSGGGTECRCKKNVTDPGFS